MISPLERRRFLVLAAASASLGWSACSRADDATAADPNVAALDNVPPGVGPALRDAWNSARASGKPLLVMLEHDDTDPIVPSWHGQVWADYFDHGGTSALADVALCEIVFASLSDVRALWPERQVAGSAELPFGLVVGPERERFVVIDHSIASRAAKLGIFDPESRPRWMPVLEAKLGDAIAPDAEAWERQARRVLGEPLPPRDEWPDELARRQRVAFAAHAPAGARWARARNACGPVIALEGGGEIGTASLCGMGLVDDSDRRFLHLYTARVAASVHTR